MVAEKVLGSKSVIVCGDSFMSPSAVEGYQGTHFSEIFATNLNYNLIAYSCGAMGNGGIAVQIETAIKDCPDFILIGTTFHTRYEWPFRSVGSVDSISIDNLLYINVSSISTKYPWINKNSFMNSAPILEALSDFEPLFKFDQNKQERKAALQSYFKYLYHDDWKQQIDYWILYAALHKLETSGIPYFLVIDHYKEEGIQLPWLTERNNLWPKVREIFQHDSRYEIDPGYHSSTHCQQEIANLLLKSLVREKTHV